MTSAYHSRYSKRRFVADERVSGFFMLLALLALVALILLLSMVSGGAEMIDYETYMRV